MLRHCRESLKGAGSAARVEPCPPVQALEVQRMPLFSSEALQRDWIEGISGTDFGERVQSCRAQLEALSPEARAQGALIAEADPIEFAAAFFTAVSWGVPAILANPNWGEREWSELSTLVSPGIFFGSVGVPPLGGLFPRQNRLKAGLQPGSILIPTGGTTGGVKLAVHTWASLTAACRGVQAFLGKGAIDSCCVLPLYHVSGLMQLLRSFITGGCIRFNEDEVAGCCLSYVPTQLQRALTSEDRTQQLTTARAIFVGGAALPESVAIRARELKLPVVPVYGMTETAAMVAAVPAQDFLKDPQAGAVPLGGAEFSVEPAGRLRIQSPALFQGYHGQVPIERESGHLTDDEARIDRDGRLHVLGRIDRLINSGGEKIDPCEVEAALLRVEGVDEALVLGQPDSEWGQRVVAYYTGSEVGDLKQQLRQWLAPYKVPKEWIHVDALPLDTRGKVKPLRKSPETSH